MPVLNPHSEIFRDILDSLQTGVYVADCNWKILFWNRGAERITGFKSHDVIGRSCCETVLDGCSKQGCDLCGAVCPVAESLNQGTTKESRIYFHHRAGHRLPVHVWTVPVRQAQGAIIGVAESFEATAYSDVRQHNLAAYGCLDETTGMPNHRFTLFHLRENLASFTEYHLPFGVLCIRVDEIERFKSSFGREAVDTILSLVARTIQSVLRPKDFVGRWSSDQFLAILTHCSPAGMETVIARFRQVVGSETFQWWGDQLRVRTSTGQATVQAGDCIESLLERARQSLPPAASQPAAAAAAAAADKCDGRSGSRG